MSKLDGKTKVGGKTLTFNVNTFCDLEEAFEVEDVNGVLSIIQGLEEHPSLKVIRKLFWVALQQEHPEMSERDAGALIGSVGIDKASEALMTAVAQAFPADDGESAEGNAPKKRRGTGRKS